MKNIIISLIAVISIATFSSCKVERTRTDLGPMTTRSVAAKDFNRLSVAVSYPADVTYMPSDSFSVSVKAPRDAFGKDLKVRVVDGELQIVNKHDTEKSHIIFSNDDKKPKISVTIKAPCLKEVEFAGEGTFTCDTTMTVDGRLELELAGSGAFNIRNIRAKAVSGEIAGAGSINANLEQVANTDIEIAGAGKLNLDFKKCGNVKIEIAGVGKATLKGDIDNLERDIAGMGKISTDGLTVRGKVTDEEDDDDF